MKESTVGIIGLGIIGQRIARCLRKAGAHVYVWNRSAKPEPNFLAGPAEMASLTNLIEIFVRNGDDLIEVIEAMRDELTPDHVIINHSTIDPESTRKANNLVTSKGAGFLDCPFTGSKNAAADAQLVYYVGGDEKLLERVRPLLELSGKQIIHTGDVGTATLLKITTNMITSTTVQALSEALSVLRASGVEQDKFLEAITHNACNSTLAQMKLPTISADDYEPHFSLANMHKDARFALEIAESHGIELPALSAVADRMKQCIDEGHSEKDFSIIAKPKPE